jgi:hypothetical protein
VRLHQYKKTTTPHLSVYDRRDLADLVLRGGTNLAGFKSRFEIGITYLQLVFIYKKRLNSRQQRHLM